MNRRLDVLAIALLLPAAACQRTSVPGSAADTESPISAPDASSATPDGALANRLPENAGAFVGERPIVEAGFVRRAYRKGSVRIEVTLAQAGAARVEYEQWLKMSAPYPQVTLDVAPGEAAGFYDCKGTGGAERCDAHVHFRGGFHLEVMGAGTATRADLEELLVGLPMRALTR